MERNIDFADDLILTAKILVVSQSPSELSRYGARLRSDEQLYRVHGKAVSRFEGLLFVTGRKR